MVELREELSKSQDQVVHLNQIAAERSSEVNKLIADINWLKRTNEVRNCITITITITMRVFSAPLYTKPDREALQQS